jgi:peptide/nickel transport system substrate-binding protein
VKRLLPGAAAATAVLLLLAACGGGDDSSATVTSSPPADRVLRMSFLQDPGQPPDPDIFYAGEGLILSNNTYEGLLQYQPGTADPKIIGALATEWAVSADKLTYTLKLREGVLFHDGTPFTSAAVKASFDRRLAVNQGPAYMVAGVASVTEQGEYGVLITLKEPDAAFLDYLASAYGPKMMSPAVLKAQAGSDNAQTYLRTHDAGTGPYTLTDAKTGSHYELKAFDKYWGAKPYFTTIDIPVQPDTSSQQLLLNKGELAIIMNRLPASAVKSYKENASVKSYSLPTMQSMFLYVNPKTSFLTTTANRLAVLRAVDVDQIVNQVYAGRGSKADQAYPPHQLPDGMAAQDIDHNPGELQQLLTTLPANQKTVTIGYDAGSSDQQLIANLLSTQFAAVGLTAKVQAFPTAQIFGWIGNQDGAPDLLVAGGWPDAAPAYTWAHISWAADGGLNYLGCSSPEINTLLDQGLPTGDPQTFSRIGTLAAATGCFYNLADQDDFMVAQTWLKGVEESHVVGSPNMLMLAGLSVG